MESNLTLVENVIGIKFKKKDILAQSLIHSSYAQQTEEPDNNNDRLHFLGDTILNLIITDYLYGNCPYLEVSKFVALREKLMEEERLTKLWFKLGLGDSYPLLSLKEDRYLLRQRRRNPFERAFKALVGAMQLDRGFPQTRNWVNKQLIAPLLERHLKKIQERSTPDQQLKFLGEPLLKAIVMDYLYRQLPSVSLATLTTLTKEIVAKEQLMVYIGKITAEDWSAIAQEDYHKEAKKSFKVLLALMYLHLSSSKTKDGLKKTSQWFQGQFIDNDEVLKRAIALLLKEGKAQKWIIKNVMGYESKRYREGRERFYQLTGQTESSYYD